MAITCAGVGGAGLVDVVVALFTALPGVVPPACSVEACKWARGFGADASLGEGVTVGAEAGIAAWVTFETTGDAWIGLWAAADWA